MKRPCPKAEETCKYAPDCFADQHHPDWPRRDYTTPLEKRYRTARAAGNIICRAEHDEIHATFRPPEKPSPDVMREYLAQVALEKACTENINMLAPNMRPDLAS